MSWKKALGLVFALAFAAVGAIAITIIVISSDLPEIVTLDKYKPLLVSEVFDRKNQKIGEFFREKRLWIDYSEVPGFVVKAFLAAEDSTFFEHGGVSFTGIMRAFVKNMISGEVKQGGSTITQQLAKGLMLTPERTIMRKIREMILAFKMESYLTKDQILEIYLNQIFLGHNAYGIRGAANAYYGKEPKDLSLAQAATLAGLTRAPSRDNPIASLERADGKRKYVLGRMLEESYITKSQYEQALDESIQPLEDENLNFKYAPYFVEHVRKYLVQKYG
ncbi:MAG: transglycosylase domain-containing protein, partial [Bdellovibrionales bacterium]|nr:transglycosylase domain-containing protein [Bdellovibrionales bacterium]